MKPGDLYYLLPMGKKFPHIQALFPYMQGGSVIVLKINSRKLRSNRNSYYLELVDFLYNGSVYTESMKNFQDNSIYIGRKNEVKH